MTQTAWTVAQLGARMHYAVPRILHRSKQLDRFATDLYLPHRFWGWLSRKLNRYRIESLPAQKITSTNIAGIRSRFQGRDPGDFADFVELSMNNADRLSRTVKRLHARQPIEAIYAFDTAADGIFDLDIPIKVLEQCIAPRSTHRRFDELAVQKGWLAPSERRKAAIERLLDCEHREWERATGIVTPSEFVKSELVSEMPELENRIAIVPYGFSPGKMQTIEETDRCERPLVLFVGTVDHRKGIVDLVSVARKLPKVDFQVIGKIESSVGSQIDFPANVTLAGSVGFDQVVAAMQNAWLFFLPSYFEGSATVIYEAMHFGLPIVTTPNAGSVVRDERDGFLVAPGDIGEMQQRIEQLVDDTALRISCGQSAKENSKNYSMERYGERLLNALNEFASNPTKKTTGPSSTRHTP